MPKYRFVSKVQLVLFWAETIFDEGSQFNSCYWYISKGAEIGRIFGKNEIQKQHNNTIWSIYLDMHIL